jgi:hypothetical protein
MMILKEKFESHWVPNKTRTSSTLSPNQDFKDVLNAPKTNATPIQQSGGWTLADEEINDRCLERFVWRGFGGNRCPARMNPTVIDYLCHPAFHFSVPLN